MILQHADWDRDVMPCMDLTEQDVENMAENLIKFHQQFHSGFGRAEHHRLGLAYFSGLLSNSKKKSIEPIALEFLGQQSVRSQQRFMKTYRWDLEAMEDRHLTMLSKAIFCPNGMINTDSSEFLKKAKNLSVLPGNTAEKPARPIIVNPVSLLVAHRKKATVC